MGNQINVDQGAQPVSRIPSAGGPARGCNRVVMTFVAIYCILFTTVGLPLLHAIDRTSLSQGVKYVNRSSRQRVVSVRLNRARAVRRRN